VITGALIIIVTGVAALMPEVRHLETRQPDYDGAPALLE
jgi:hypothetical protein